MSSSLIEVPPDLGSRVISLRKNWAWTQSHDDTKLVEKLKIGNKAIMEAISHRGTITKDTFILTGFTKALERLNDLCR